jgi:hypothetical protein
MLIYNLIKKYFNITLLVNSSFCGSGGWVAFTDEKCFKLVDILLPHEEAEQICINQDNQNKTSLALNFLPTLASIKSLEEQQYCINESTGPRVSCHILLP